MKLIDDDELLEELNEDLIIKFKIREVMISDYLTIGTTVLLMVVIMLIARAAG